MMLKVEKIDNFETFLAIKEEWSLLLSRSDADNFYLTHQWLSAFWKNLGAGKQLLVICVKENGKIISAVPLMISRGTLMGIPVKKIECIGAGWGHSGFILTEKKDECVKGVFDFLKHHLRDCIIVLSSLCNNQEDIERIRNVLRVQKLRSIIEVTKVPFVSLRDGWDSYSEALGSGFQKRIKRIEKKFQKDGGVAVENVQQTNGIEVVMRQVFEISLKSWKAKAGTAIASQVAVKGLYSDLAQRLNDSGWLNIFLLRVGERPICYLLGAAYNKRYYAIDTAFDLEAAPYSPGMYCIYSALKTLGGERMEDFDFVMDHPYKKDFSNLIRDYTTIYVFGNGLFSGVLYALRARVFHRVRDLLKRKRGREA